MRRIGILALVVAGAAIARAEDIYRWTDSAGGVHYSNSPVVDPRGIEVTTEPGVAPTAPDEAAEAAATPDENASDDVSLDASRRRNDLERDLRSTQTRLHDLETRLGHLESARTRHAAGNEATGGLGTNAADVTSEEEKVLTEEHEQLEKQVAGIHAAADKLRQELTDQLGGTPSWWNDLR